MSDSLELQQLRELIEIFKSEYSIDEVEEANRIAGVRYEALDNQIPTIGERLKAFGVKGDVETWLAVCTAFHAILFEDIISINGKFRHQSHPGGGDIYFGGQKHLEMRPRFSGSKPQDINTDLEIAFGYLSNQDAEDPVEQALRFYQKFVYTHPFYDGNGRIARLIVNLYLFKYNRFIDWKNLQNKGGFLNKLNRYHESGLDRHFIWWKKICEKYVYEISEEDRRD